MVFVLWSIFSFSVGASYHERYGQHNMQHTAPTVQTTQSISHDTQHSMPTSQSLALKSIASAY